MKKVLIAASALMISAVATAEPLWLRNTAISPDGQTIAFTYEGEIYTVPASGGAANRLTTIGYNTKPIWSPDGTKIAFASDREGSMDVYVMPAKGGKITRLTTNSGKEEPRAWLGNDTILFATSMLPAPGAAQAAFTQQVYKVSATNPGRPVQYVSWPMQAISVGTDGRVLFQDKKGYEDVLRKHEHSSGTADVWLLDGGKYTMLTSANVQNQNPVWAPDGKSFYYTTEAGNGTMNVHQRTIDGASDKALTEFKDHPVRSLSAANNGKMAFSWNGEIYTLTPGAQPQKVKVDISTDDYQRELVRQWVKNRGVTDLSVSPDGEEVAFVVRGDVYVANVKYGTTKQITNTPQQERTVDFAPDGRTIVYDSERDGQWQLFTASIKDKDEKHFAYATEIEETPLYKSAEGLPAFQPQWSPDGKEVAFLENRTALRVVDEKGKNVRTALDGKFNYSYTDGDISFEWSPDSKWFLIDYIGVGGWNNIDVALVKADGSQVVDLTESGYSDGNAHWALDGKAIVWATDRNGYRSHGSWGSQRDAYIMFLDGHAYDRFRMTEEEEGLADAAGKDDKKDKKDEDKEDDKEKKQKKVKPLEFDLENAKYRVARLTPGAGGLGDFFLSKKGDKFYYVTDGTLYERDLKKGDTKSLSSGVWGSLESDSKGENVFYSANGLKKLNLGSGKVETVDYSADREYHPAAEREYIYDHMLRQVENKFYDPTLHGVDWKMYGEAYRRFLPHISNNYDFAELLSEILGELNASHTGGRYYAGGADRNTAVLGAFFDETYDGDGLKIQEVIKRGPLDVKSANIKSGDVILAIEGKEIKAGQDYYPLLDGRADRRTRLTIKRGKGGKTEDITVKPISSGAQSDLLYRRWVERNQAVVDSVSDGRIAYVHVEGMDSPSFRTVFSELLGKYRNHEAVIVDTRYNGGGWLHNDIAVLLSGKEYVRFVPRGQYIGSEPFTRWTKPSVMLVNESNYSDAHGTPYTYQTLGLGEVIGAPIPGTMTAVWWENQVDPSLVFGIPQVTSMDMEGNVLENKQLNPDVVIYNRPEEVQRGYDAQLVGATKRLLEKLPAKSAEKK
ncbi:MAG: PDZ domain-containing protein [Muribaculaceae bacterium]|nr:PDZ domain-containing protein [Muribaculaceae bacterium]